MPSKYAPDHVLNPIRRRIFRRSITRAEMASSGVLVAALFLAGLWILVQRDNFDPGERDVSYEALVAGSIEELPYRAQLVRWREPGSADAGASGPDLGVFPVGLLDGGWELDGRVETYDESNLYEKINGQAEQYLKFDFRKLHYVTLAREDTYLTLELYDQARFRNTLGVFAAQRDPEQKVETRGPLVFYRTAIGAIGLLGNYFFKITASAPGEPVAAKTESLLSALAELETAGDASDEGFSILADGLRLPFSSISFAKENALQFDFLREVWFATVGGADGARVFLHRADSEEAARELYGQLVAEQKYEHALVDGGDSRSVMKHEFLGTWFAVARRGSWLYGVDGGASSQDAGALLSSLEKEIS
ncbi:MAG: hypothetical protein OEQ13_07810 [Acidobacteriota bacterium]|nr:hypothetical protein [Acidobacteriota bacterium]